MSPINKVLFALGITLLVAGISIGAYYLYKNNSNGNTPNKNSSNSSKNSLNGPYYHQIYSASSKDGLSWTKNDNLIFDHASVPGALIKDNKIYLYFVDASGDSDQLSVAISSDNGKTFGKQQEVKISGVKNGDAVDPHPELINNKIRLYYFGNFASMANSNNKSMPTFYSAESTDGVNFNDVKEVYKSDDSKQIITDPDVFQTDSDWQMLLSKGKNMDLAISKDGGLSFTKQNGFSWNSGGVSDTFNFDGTFRTYYCGNGGILSATGANSDTMKTESGIRISADNKIVCDPSVIKLPDGAYLMFYKTQDMIQQNQQQGTGSQPNQTPGQAPSQSGPNTVPTTK